MKKLLLVSSLAVASVLPCRVAFAQTTVAPGGVIIQQPERPNASAADQLSVCLASLNRVQNETEGFVTLYGTFRPLAFDHPYRYAKPSNVPDDEMRRVGLRNRDGDDVWVGDVASVSVRVSNTNNLTNRDIMELCLNRTPQFTSPSAPAGQPPYYPSPVPTSVPTGQPSYYPTLTPTPTPVPTGQPSYQAPPALPTSQPSSPTILRVGNPNQPVPIDVSAQISASLAGRGLTPVSCALNPGVTVTVGEYMACAYPTPSYPAGRYTLR
jgi:hypothetical protein